MTSVEEVIVVSLIVHELGSLCHGAVSDGVLHVVSHGLVEVLVGRDETVFHTKVLTSVRTHLGIFQCLVGQLLVEALEALYQDVGQCYDARIAHHAVSLIAPQMPYRKLALLLVDAYHRVGDIIDLLRMDDRHQRNGCAVGVPQ